VHLAYWLNCSMAAAIVVAATGIFLLVWICSPTQGLVRRVLHRFLTHEEEAMVERPAAAKLV
jgi:hypothetical protein